MKTAPTGALNRASLIACASLCATAPLHAAKTWTGAADATWANTANWLEAALPGTNETVIFDANSAANLTIDTGAARTVRGINLSSPAGTVTLSNNTLTLGKGGINMSAANRDLILNSTVAFASEGKQSWSLATGRSITVAAAPAKDKAVNAVVEYGTTGTIKLGAAAVSRITDNFGNPYATYGTNDFAALDVSGNVVATAYEAAPGGAGLPAALDLIKDIQGSYTGANGVFVPGLRFNSATPVDVTISNSGTSRTMTACGILVTANSGASSIGGNLATNAFIRCNRPGGGGGISTFNIIQNSAADFTIGAIISNSSSTTSRLVKTGPGKLISLQNNGYSSGTYIDQGTIQFGDGVVGHNGFPGGGDITNFGSLIFKRAEALTLVHNIAGTGTFTQEGPGQLDLTTSVSTFTGDVNILGGTLGVTAMTNLGAGTNINIDNGGTFKFLAAIDPSVRPIIIGAGGAGFDSNGLSVTLANPVGTGSAGALAKKGTGSLSLAAANTYLGGTAIDGGTLLATNTSGSATGTGPVAVNTGGTLGGSGNIDGAVTVGTGGTVSPGSGVGTLTVDSLDLQSGSALTIEFGAGNDQVTVQNAGGLNIGGGAVTLRQEGTANPFAVVGTYTLMSYSGALGGAATNLTVANPQPGFTYNFAAAGGAVTLTIGTSGVVRDWNVNGGGSWTNNANWTGAFPNAAGATANFDTNLSSPATVTLDGDKIVGAITFLSGTHGYTIAPGSGGSLILNNGANNGSILDGDGVHTISAPITLTSNTTVSTAGADDGMILSGAITGGGTLTKTGPGSLDLLSSNGFTGVVTLAGGTTTFVNGGLGSGNLVLTSSRLVWASGNGQDISNRTITFESGTIEFDNNGNDITLVNPIGNSGTADFIKSGEGRLTLGGDATFTGTVTVAAGELQLGTGGATGSVSADIVNNGTLIFNRADGYENFDAISGTGSLIHAGSGVLGLGGANTFSGTTSIPNPAASLILLNGSALQNSTLQYPSSGGSISFYFNGAATLGGLEGDKNLPLTNDSPGPVALTVGGNNQSTTYTGILSGDGSLTKIGTGTLVLGPVAHTYTGATTINGGVLELPAGGSIATTTANTGVGGRLYVNGGSLTSSAFSTYQNGGIAVTLESGSLAFNGGVQSSQNDGSLMEIFSGNFSALDVIIRRSLVYNNDANGNPAPAVAGNSGFVVNGGTAAITNTLQVGTGNSSASALVTGGSLSVGGVVTLGNTTHGSRWSMLEIRGGSFTSTEATQGIVLSPNAATGNLSMFLVSGGTATVERIGFGASTGAAGTGRVAVSAGELYVGSGGLVQDAPAFTSQIQLSGGILAAKAPWSSSLPVALSNSATIQAADAAFVPRDITLSGAVTGTGSLVKEGGGTLTLSGSYSYSGNTTVFAGTLSLGTGTLSDTGIVDVSATGSAVLNLNFSGSDTVAGFSIDGVAQAAGTWGSLTSTATHKTGRITGTGLLVVPASDPFASWIDDFAVGGLTGKGDDPDGDGLTNLVEFALDGDPASGTATGKVRSRIETVGADRVLVITLPVRNGASFGGGNSKTATIDDIVYTIQGTNNLSTFDQGVTEIAVSAAGMPTPLTEGWSYRTFRLNGAIGGVTPRGPRGFLRATIEDATP